jgi:hypothetical protein
LLADEVFEAKKGDLGLPPHAETFDGEEFLPEAVEATPAIPLPVEEAPPTPAAAPEWVDDTDRLTDLALRLENLASLMEDPLRIGPLGPKLRRDGYCRARAFRTSLRL